MRQVVQRRKRCSVRQSRNCLDDPGLSVRASIGDLEDAAGLAPQLPRDVVEIRPVNHREAVAAARAERTAPWSGHCAGRLRWCATARCTTAGLPARARLLEPAHRAARRREATAPGMGYRRA